MILILNFKYIILNISLAFFNIIKNSIIFIKKKKLKI